MNKLLTLLTFISLNLPSLASAAPAEVLEAVLKSDAFHRVVGNQNDIIEIKETAIYRCPGCFTIEVTLGRGEAARKESFSTRLAGFNGVRRYEITHKAEEASTVGRCIAVGRVGGEDRACAQHNTRAACENKDKWEWCAWRTN